MTSIYKPQIELCSVALSNNISQIVTRFCRLTKQSPQNKEKAAFWYDSDRQICIRLRNQQTTIPKPTRIAPPRATPCSQSAQPELVRRGTEQSPETAPPPIELNAIPLTDQFSQSNMKKKIQTQTRNKEKMPRPPRTPAEVRPRTRRRIFGRRR